MIALTRQRPRNSGPPPPRRSRARRAGVVLVGVCLLVGCVAVASAATRTGTADRRAGTRTEIDVGVGIGAASLGASQAAIEAALGRPVGTAAPDLSFAGQSVGLDYWHRVDAVWTSSDRARTVRGIGPGSPLIATRRAYPGAHCTRLASQRWSTVCSIRSAIGAVRTETDFMFRGGRVMTVQIFTIGAPPRSRGMQ
jgi:hypothetical protein